MKFTYEPLEGCQVRLTVRAGDQSTEIVIDGNTVDIPIPAHVPPGAVEASYQYVLDDGRPVPMDAVVLKTQG